MFLYLNMGLVGGGERVNMDSIDSDGEKMLESTIYFKIDKYSANKVYM